MEGDRLTLAKLRCRGIRAQVKGRSAASDTGDGVRLDLLPTTKYDGYANAQIDDYRIDKRNIFRWSANVKMTLRARFTTSAHELTGTAGFGFWNAPVGLGERRLPSPPAAAWFFFAGPNSNIAAARGVPGHGWKAASIDAQNRCFLLLLPTAPIALPLMRVPYAYDRLWPVAQRAMRVDERSLDNRLDEWHEYVLTWTDEFVRYEIDGSVIHTSYASPRARMGFVAWIDNQYMVATPRGHFGQGIVPIQRARSLDIAGLRLSEL